MYPTQKQLKKMKDFDREMASMPISGSLGMYIPWDREKKDYDTRYYRGESLSGHVSLETLENTISDLKSLGRLYSPFGMRPWLILTPITSLVLTGLFIGSIVYISSKEEYSSSTKAIAIVVCGLIWFSLCLIFHWYFVSLTSSYLTKRLISRRKEAEAILEKCNNTHLLHKKSECRMSMFGAYIAVEYCGFNSDPRSDDRSSFVKEYAEKDKINGFEVNNWQEGGEMEKIKIKTKPKKVKPPI